VVSPDEFERQLNQLRNKTILPLREFAKLRIQKKVPRNAVAITFDDGYACNALVAAPMLESFGYPATFFVVSDAIARSEEFWWDQLKVIFHAQEFNYEIAKQALVSRRVNGHHGTANQDGAQLDDFLTLWEFLRRLSAEERRQYLGDLRDRCGLENKTRPTHRPMTAEELRVLAANPLFEVGGHTASHPSLPTLAAAEQEQEIVLGARFLEATIGKPIRSFSYPFGDWGEVTRDIVMAAGFECAVTAQHRRVRSGDGQFELPRRQVVNRTARTP
jgi:peptidoglycan/xylan/chitin deacetylase (PgdA/CDA1 family)